MKAFVILITFSLFTSCAGLHSGARFAKQLFKSVDPGRSPSSTGDKKMTVKDSKVTNLGLVISGALDDSYSSLNFGLLRFTFENRTDEWIQIRDIKLSFNSKTINNSVSFVSGVQLDTYLKAIEKRNEIERLNSRTFSDVEEERPRVSSFYSGNSKLYTAGKYYQKGVRKSLSINSYYKSSDKNEVQSDKIFPENHLFHSDFLIPPGMFAEKFVLINSWDHERIGFLEELKILYETATHNREMVILEFRKSLSVAQRSIASIETGSAMWMKWMQDVADIPQYQSRDWKSRVRMTEESSKRVKNKRYKRYKWY